MAIVSKFHVRYIARYDMVKTISSLIYVSNTRWRECIRIRTVSSDTLQKNELMYVGHLHNFLGAEIGKGLLNLRGAVETRIAFVSRLKSCLFFYELITAVFAET